MSADRFITPQTHRTASGIAYAVSDERLPWQQDDAPVVFHHGVGARGAIWLGWNGALAERHRLVRMDMRGHGGSEVPEGYRWTMGNLVADLHAVIAHCHEGDVHLVGESIGGSIAIAYAIAHPERVRTLCVSNGAHRGERIQNLGKWPEIMGAGGMRAWSEYMMDCRFHAGAISRAAWNWYMEQQAQASSTAVLDAVAVLVDTDLSAQLDELRAPTLLMHPDASPFIPVDMMAELKHKLPDARLQVFANAKHGLPFSHAAQCAALYANFLIERA